MKTNSLLLITLLLVSTLTFGQSVHFEKKGLKEAMDKAKKENKVLFLEAYTEWCSSCKYMSSSVFPQAIVGKYYNEHFVNYKLNMETDEAIGMDTALGVYAYPTLLFISPKGEILHRYCGGLDPLSFIDLAKIAQNETLRFAYFKNEFKKGNRDPKLVSIYFEKCEESCLPFDSDITTYFNSVKNEDLYNIHVWDLYKNFQNNSESPLFTFVEQNYKKLEEKHGVDSVQNKMYNVYFKSVNDIFTSKALDENAYSNWKSRVEKSPMRDKKLLMMYADLEYYSRKNDLNSWVKTASEIVDNYSANRPDMLNNLAYELAEKTEDKAMLKKAEQWVQKSLDMENVASTNDTHAFVLSKMGRKDEAIKAEERAIELAKNAGDDTAIFEYRLEEIKSK